MSDRPLYRDDDDAPAEHAPILTPQSPEPRTAAGRWVVDVIPEPFDLGSGPYYIVQEADDVPERAVFYTEADAELFRRAIEAEAAAPLDVATLTDAMDFDRVDAQAIIRKHGYVFARNLAEVTAESDEAARWDKLAFTLYSMLLPSNRRSEHIAAEYARLLRERNPGASLSGLRSREPGGDG